MEPDHLGVLWRPTASVCFISELSRRTELCRIIPIGITHGNVYIIII